MANIDVGSTGQLHDNDESSYHLPDDGKSNVNNGRKYGTKSVPPRKGTTLLVIEETKSEIDANTNAKKSNDIVDVDR
eukprot:10015106-Ditylum_brightwellii.AAC.1